MPTKTPPRSPPKKRLRLVGKVVPLHAAAEAPAAPVRARTAMARDLPALAHQDVIHTLAEMARVATEASSATEAQRAQLGVIQALAEPKTSFVAQFFPAKNQLQVGVVRGRNDARIRAVNPSEGPVGRAYAERRVVEEDGIVAAPIVHGDTVTGCLVLVSPRVHLPAEVMEALAAHLASALDFARLRDDSDRRNKDLQTALAGLKSLERQREELLSNVSNDLKDPLNTVKAYLGMLTSAKLGPVNEAQGKALAVCERNADRLLRMITDLLLISRLQTGKMELTQKPFGLKALVEELQLALRPLAEALKVELKLKRSPEVFVRGDRERVSEALYNLIDHCLGAAPKGTAVEVAVSDRGGLAVVSISDTGPAISEEDAVRLFDAYARPRGNDPKSSHGLALPIAAKILHLHGGRVEAEGTASGTTLRAALPLFAGAVAPIRAVPERRAGGILLVEDDVDCREVLQQVLETEGYRVLSVASAGEARAVLENIRPGLVLLDLRLRDEDGTGVLHFIRERETLADIPVYLVSGSSELASLGKGTGKDRIDGYFEKPLQLPKLLDMVASVVTPSRPRGRMV